MRNSNLGMLFVLKLCSLMLWHLLHSSPSPAAFLTSEDDDSYIIISGVAGNNHVVPEENMVRKVQQLGGDPCAPFSCPHGLCTQSGLDYCQCSFVNGNCYTPGPVPETDQEDQYQDEEQEPKKETDESEDD